MPHPGNSTRNALSQAPVTVAGGVVLYPSMDKMGNVFFLEATTGKLLHNYTTGATNACGASVANGSIYTGSGYQNFGLGSPSQTFTALVID
jgi:polyvinyl alcohol dehydrogenase (cytochrome)